MELQTTSSAVRQVQLDLPAQPALRADRIAIADQKHPDHQLRIDRGTPRVTVVGRKLGPKPTQIEYGVDLAQQMIGRHHVL
jgi:hypothetical protein